VSTLSPFSTVFCLLVMFTLSNLAFCDAGLPFRFDIGEWRLFVNDYKLITIQSKYSLRTLCILFDIHLPDFCVPLNKLT